MKHRRVRSAKLKPGALANAIPRERERVLRHVVFTEARDICQCTRTDGRTDELTADNALLLLPPDETLTFSSSRRRVVNVPAEPMIRMSDADDELLAVVCGRRTLHVQPSMTAPVDRDLVRVHKKPRNTIFDRLFRCT